MSNASQQIVNKTWNFADVLNLDIFWLRDKSLEDSENLPEPDISAQEIADDLQTALDQFSAIAADLRRQD